MHALFEPIRRIRGIGWYTAGAVLNAALAIALPAFLGGFVDSLVYGKTSVALSFVLLAGASFCSMVVSFAMNDFLAVQGNHFTHRLRERILAKTATLAPARTDGTKRGTVAAKIYQDVSTAGQLLGTFYGRALESICALVFALALVLVKRPVVCLAFLVPVPLAIWLALRRQGRLQKLAEKVRLGFQDLFTSVDSYLRPISFLRAQHAEGPFLPDPIRSSESLDKALVENARAAFRLGNEQRGLLFLGEFSILAFAGHSVLAGEMPVGDMVLFQTMFVALFSSLSGIFDLLPSWEGIKEAFRSLRAFQLLEEEPSGEVALPAGWGGEIRAEHLSYAYPGQERPAVEDLSFQINHGDLIALTGGNGAGKTTLLKLLCSYMAPTGGSLSYGSTDSRQLEKSSLRDRIGIVFQDQLLLDGTIRENITLRDSRYGESELAEALRLSGADDVVARFPNGLDHVVGDSSPLSGGERQKIALARALIRTPRLLILDEVSNHLDGPSREALSRRLRELHGIMTIILVSHEPSLIALCDRIIAV